MHTSRLTRVPGDPVLVQKIFAPTPALQAYSAIHSSKSPPRTRASPPNENVKISWGMRSLSSAGMGGPFFGGTGVFCETAVKMLFQSPPPKLPSGEEILSRSGGHPGVFVPPPAQAWQQTVHMIAGIAHSEPSPDQTSDSFRGPNGGIKSMGYRSLRQKAGKAREFFARQFGTAPGFRTPAQPFLSTQAMP
jgi:hypothetical protein